MMVPRAGTQWTAINREQSRAVSVKLKTFAIWVVLVGACFAILILNDDKNLCDKIKIVEVKIVCDLRHAYVNFEYFVLIFLNR